MFRVVPVRAESVFERRTVVDVRVCWGVADFVRRFVVVPSRTAAHAGAHDKKPRNAPKIRIFFISDKMLAKFVNMGQVFFDNIWWYFCIKLYDERIFSLANFF